MNNHLACSGRSVGTQCGMKAYSRGFCSRTGFKSSLNHSLAVWSWALCLPSLCCSCRTMIMAISKGSMKRKRDNTDCRARVRPLPSQPLDMTFLSGPGLSILERIPGMGSKGCRRNGWGRVNHMGEISQIGRHRVPPRSRALLDRWPTSSCREGRDKTKLHFRKIGA